MFTATVTNVEEMNTGTTKKGVPFRSIRARFQTRRGELVRTLVAFGSRVAMLPGVGESRRLLLVPSGGTLRVATAIEPKA